MKKLTAFGIGIGMVMTLSGLTAFAPLVASAQSVSVADSLNAQLLSLYLQLIQILQQQLRSLQGGNPPSNTNTSAALIASVTSGQAPLAVTFLGDTAAGCNGGNFTLDYDDGTSDTLAIPADLCRGTFSRTHTFSTPGAHLVKLFAVAGNQILSAITITVSAASVSQNFTATPLQGNAPLTVNFSGLVPGTAYSLNFGDNTTAQVATCSNGCTTIGVATSHVYTTAGSYSAVLTNTTNSSIVGTAGITVSSVGTLPALFANPQSGAAPLSTSFFWYPNTASGTSSLYYLNFGDNSATSSAWIAGTDGQSVIQQHTYMSAGTFGASLTNTSNGVVIATTSVAVSSASGGWVTNGQLTASAASGVAPLSVTFITPLIDSHLIDFGDRTTSRTFCTSARLGTPGCTYSTTHTYTSPGTYVVQLLPPNAVLVGWQYCTDFSKQVVYSSPGCSLTTLGTITITVSSPPANSGTNGRSSSSGY